MTLVQLFGVLVRIAGLVLVLYTTPRVFESLALIQMGISGDPNLASFSVQGIVRFGCTFAVCIAGVWLLRGPKRLIAFAYREELAAKDELSSATH